MPVPTWRLAAAAALAVPLLLLLPFGVAAGLLVVNGVLLTAAVVDWALAVRPDRLRVTRDLPSIVPLDGEATITWTVGNPTGRRLHVDLADELPPSLLAAARRARLVIPARGQVVARTAARPSRRGRFDPAGMTLRVRGPLGLAARQRRVPVHSTMRVYPPFHSRKQAELRIERGRILEVGLRSARSRGGGTEFDSLREYGIDDESRRIDWAATARSDRAIVRTYRSEQNQHVLILLDAGRTMAGRIEAPAAGFATPVPRLDHAMDAVLALTAVATRLGDRTGLVAFDNEVRSVVPPAHGRRQLGQVTEALYALEPALAESDYRQAFTTALTRFRRRALLVLFTELAAEAVEETLIPALPLLARSHLVLVASVTDPEVATWARATPTESATAYRKAAAVAALERRRRTVTRLRALGATVIDAEPGQLAPRLADAYLKVKATGGL